ncbi:uncharacterized protein LOC133556222 isoform X2 [Nerophis ophidion]|uniref:uncharacterized protein LOC133556222 isoform X2 n=1 Tax=Nerophis ophidion TaxID=159077 RepID=UPI002ADF81E4|nr:uncharacterized protein LOC133556222 isoform X2 [Nerophis ophidion]
MMPTWSSSLELDWQDVLAVIQPEDDCYDSEVLQKNVNYYKNARENLKDGQQGFECPCPHLRPQWSLLPLGSITEIHEHTSAFTADDVTSGMFPPDNFGFMTEGPLGDVHVGQNANSTLELRERWQSSRSLSHQDYVSWDADSQSHTWSCTPSFEGHFINQDFLSSPSSGFLLEDHRLLSPLSDFLQMTSFDCFGPEMAGGQDDYLDHDAARQEAAHFRHKLASRTEREDPNSAMTIMEDEREPKSHPQEGSSESSRPSYTMVVHASCSFRL